MRRADRLFDIIQALRGRPTPMTAAALAAELEVSSRTVYRDIATLQARRIPIEGEPGIGYVLKRGFDLPPLMFTTDEIEAIAMGVGMLHRVRDPKLDLAAQSVLQKLKDTVPRELKAQLAAPRFWVSEGSVTPPTGIALADLRIAIRDCLKIKLRYVDEQERLTERIIWPVATVYYVDVTLVAAWCQIRESWRYFRIDRIVAAEILNERFANDGGVLMREWFAHRAALMPSSEVGQMSTPHAA